MNKALQLIYLFKWLNLVLSNDPMFDSKRVFAQDSLWFCLDNVLLLLHPFMLFVMEDSPREF